MDCWGKRAGLSFALYHRSLFKSPSGCARSQQLQPLEERTSLRTGGGMFTFSAGIRSHLSGERQCWSYVVPTSQPRKAPFLRPSLFTPQRRSVRSASPAPLSATAGPWPQFPPLPPTSVSGSPPPGFDLGETEAQGREGYHLTPATRWDHQATPASRPLDSPPSYPSVALISLCYPGPPPHPTTHTGHPFQRSLLLSSVLSWLLDNPAGCERRLSDCRLLPRDLGSALLVSGATGARVLRGHQGAPEPPRAHPAPCAPPRPASAPPPSDAPPPPASAPPPPGARPSPAGQGLARSAAPAPRTPGAPVSAVCWVPPWAPPPAPR